MKRINQLVQDHVWNKGETDPAECFKLGFRKAQELTRGELSKYLTERGYSDDQIESLLGALGSLEMFD